MEVKTQNTYLTRNVEKIIERKLKTSGGVLVEGPKYCGKTTTCKKYAKSTFSLSGISNIELANTSPISVLQGETPRLIDEWQNAPDLWNVGREEIDSRHDFGQFLFAGSSTPADKSKIYHSGAGRFVKVAMKPMSLFESLESNGQISLSSLFENGNQKIYAANSCTTLQDIAFFICRGGWPMTIGKPREEALEITENYCSALFEFENTNNAAFRNKKASIFRLVLKTYARNISTEARKATMMNDINEREGRMLDDETFSSYLEALRDLYIVEDIDAWSPNLRSKTAVITTPTRHFVDTSIAAGVLGINPNDMLNDSHSFGYFFEDLAIRDLSIYTASLGGSISHYRDSNGLECDAIIHLKNGKYALVEIKLGSDEAINKAADNLRRLAGKIMNAGLAGPTFMMILTAVGHAKTLDENTYVVPITMLKD